MFSSKSFIVSGLKFKSLIYFEFIFVYGFIKCSSFILLLVAVQFSQYPLLKRLSFLYCIFLPPLSKIRYPQVQGFISGLSILFHWSIFLFLWQYLTVLMTIALQYSVKSGSLISPPPFFFLKTALAIQGLLYFQMNCDIFCAAAAAAKSLQSCPTLWDPMDCSLPGFSVHGILQARTLEWVAISFSSA